MTTREIGFTGTQRGMTPLQHDTLYWLWVFKAVGAQQNDISVTLHHGDCVGADKEADDIASELGWRREGWPYQPISGSRAKRAYCPVDLMHPVNPDPMNRNLVIAQRAVDGLYATPAEYVEQLRSGTWSTIRRARKLKRRVVIIYRDGSNEVLNPDGTVDRWPLERDPAWPTEPSRDIRPKGR